MRLTQEQSDMTDQAVLPCCHRWLQLHLLLSLVLAVAGLPPGTRVNSCQPLMKAHTHWQQWQAAESQKHQRWGHHAAACFLTIAGQNSILFTGWMSNRCQPRARVQGQVQEMQRNTVSHAYRGLCSEHAGRECDICPTPCSLCAQISAAYVFIPVASTA